VEERFQEKSMLSKLTSIFKQKNVVF